MKKFILLGMSAIVLGACANDSGETTESQETSTEQTENTSQESTTQETASNGKEINKTIVDDENVKAELVSIEKVEDDTWGDTIKVKFDVTNNTENTITVQAREVSINDRMVDDSLLFMSDDISAGKSADVILEITDLAGEAELPELAGNLEMLLHMFAYDSETYDTLFENDYPVSAPLD